MARRIDRALRARPRDHALFGVVVRHLATGVSDASLWEPIDAAGAELLPLEVESRRLAQGFDRIEPSIALVDATNRKGPYDKTLLLLLGQERAKIAVVIDADSVTFAAPFDSGLNFLEKFGISGGMPTVVSLHRSKLVDALRALGVKADETLRFQSVP